RIHDPDRSQAGAIGALAAIASGESSYATANGGYYDTLECLRSGACIPGVHASAFLSPDLTGRGEFRGYRLTFHAGPQARKDAAKRPRSSMTRFAIVATPIPSATKSRHSFCADDRRRIYFTIDVAPRVRDGRCLDGEPLQ